MSIPVEPSASVPATSHLTAVPAQQKPASAPESAGPLPPGDAVLIAASRSGDAAAYATLYQRHVAAANSLAQHLVRDLAEADDVVAESFAKVLDLLGRGGGPQGAFRPYLLTVVRRAAYDRHRVMRRQLVTDQLEAFDPGIPFADPAVAHLERSMVARAFASLPERWQAVLWHTEIEGAKPAEVASLLGLSANGVAALAYRAREALRQAYLQMHLSGAVPRECRPVVAKLGAYVRGGLTKRDAAVVAGHLDQCAYCQEVFAELGDVNAALRGIVAPLILGPAAAAYLASIAANGTAAATAGGASGWAAKLAWFRHAPKQVHGATAAGVASVTVAGLAAAVMTIATHGGPAAGGAAGHRPLPPAAAVAPRSLVTSSRTAYRQRPAPGSSRSLPSSAAPSTPASGLPPVAASGLPPVAAPAPVTSSAATPPPAATGPVTPVSPASASTAPTATAPVTVVAAPGPASSRNAQLTTKINPVGTLWPGGIGMVAFTVTNTSTVTAARLTAAVTLPFGVSYLAVGSRGLASGGPAGLDSRAPTGPGGWTCTRVSSGAACTHGRLAPGSSARAELRVVIAIDAPAGAPPAISVHDAGHRVSARGTFGVRASGFPGSFGAPGSSRASRASRASGSSGSSAASASSGASGSSAAGAAPNATPARNVSGGCGSSSSPQSVVWQSYPLCQPSASARASVRRAAPRRLVKHPHRHPL